MTELQDSEERRVKRMRYTGLALSLIWAVSSTVALVFIWLLAAERSNFVMAWCAHAPLLALALLPWVSAALPWRSQAVGGIALLIVGFVELILLIGAILLGLSGWTLRWVLDVVAHPAGLLLLSTAPLPLMAGILLLKTSRRSAWLRQKRRFVLASALVAPPIVVAVVVACMALSPIFACLINYFVNCILPESPPTWCAF